MGQKGQKISKRAAERMKQLDRDSRNKRSLIGVAIGKQQQGLQVIIAKLWARSDTDARRYAWNQHRITNSDTEEIPVESGGLEGFTETRSAYDISGAGADLTDSIVVLARQAVRQADDTFQIEWVIVGSANESSCEFQYQAKYTYVANGPLTCGFMRAHPVLP